MGRQRCSGKLVRAKSRLAARLRIVFRMSSPLGAARRIVVKVGSALLVDPAVRAHQSRWLKTLVADLLALRERGQQVILVSSGAIALGRRELKLPPGPLRLEESQAAAAVGQIRLAHAYKELLEERASR
jgi:glutamate 5-kinase